MPFKRKTQVEFCSSIACKIISPPDYSDTYGAKSIKVPEGTVGHAYTQDDFDTLPGDVPVMITIQVPDDEHNVIVAAREGCLAAVEFEVDPDTDEVTFKRYRGIKVKA